MQRKIIHFDLDAFFASVEQRDNPKLRGKPVIVCNLAGGRGVVSTASYEARKYKVKSGMPGFRARKLCPHGYFVAPNFQKYHMASDIVYDILYEYTDQIEPAGLDEAYLDVTYNKKGIPSATWLAQDIRYQIFRETQLTVSAGVASNKLVAKIASDFNKPNGLTVVPPEKAQGFLADLPVRKIPGIGPVTENACWNCGIKKIKDFLKYEDTILEEWFGSSGPVYKLSALGTDNRPLTLNRIRKSCSIEDTLPRNIGLQEEAYPVLKDLAFQLERKLLQENVSGRTVILKLKYKNFQLITRRKTLLAAVNDWRTIFLAARELLQLTEIGKREVRLIGIGLSGLQEGTSAPPPLQPLLFE